MATDPDREALHVDRVRTLKRHAAVYAVGVVLITAVWAAPRTWSMWVVSPLLVWTQILLVHALVTCLRPVTDDEARCGEHEGDYRLAPPAKSPGVRLVALVTRRQSPGHEDLPQAAVIRGVLLPASMKLLGGWNWYLPSWLDWLSKAHVEGDVRHGSRPAGGVPVVRPEEA
jgi:hypothetical protein